MHRLLVSDPFERKTKKTEHTVHDIYLLKAQTTYSIQIGGELHKFSVFRSEHTLDELQNFPTCEWRRRHPAFVHILPRLLLGILRWPRLMDLILGTSQQQRDLHKHKIQFTTLFILSRCTKIYLIQNAALYSDKRMCSQFHFPKGTVVDTVQFLVHLKREMEKL